MSDLLSKFDHLLANDGPAAVVLKQWLKPVGDEVIFPPTYAAPKGDADERPRYNLDRFRENGVVERSVCVIDSIASQANRIEPAFETLAEGKLVPQIVVTAEKTGESINLLAAGHRIADAIVRFSGLREDIEKVFKARLKGDSLPLAKLAPTSLIFGVWDSRSSGVKVPRLLNSIIRAHNVDQHTRSAQYVPALKDYADAGVAAEAGEKGLRKLADEGMAAVPATGALGGVTVHGDLVRDASLNLATLRDITAGEAKQTRSLQRYLLGLSLVALSYFDNKTLNLRQGCQLVADKDRRGTRTLIFADGTDKPFELTRDDAIAFATAAAEAFKVGPDRRDVKFDTKLAKAALAKKEKGEDK